MRASRCPLQQFFVLQRLAQARNDAPLLWVSMTNFREGGARKILLYIQLQRHLISFLLVVHWTESKPAIKADVPGDRKYLVIGESVDRFLYCTAVDVPLADVILCLLTPIHFFQVNSHRDPRYRYRCETTPKNVTCAYSVSNVKETDAGLYICAVHNCGDVVHSDVHVFTYSKSFCNDCEHVVFNYVLSR